MYLPAAPTRFSITIAAFTFYCLLPCFIQAEEWPRFRGPTGQGISSEKQLPLTWSDTENIAWKTAVPGEGWSSPVVWGNRIFVTATTEEGTSCHVICVNRVSGAIEWNKKVFKQETRHKRKDNSYATPTPVTDGEQVFAVFGSGGIAALSVQGELQWTNKEIKFYSQHGLGASPILHGDMLIMPFDGSSDGEDNLIGFKKGWDGAVVMALDKKTGAVQWRGKRGSSRLAHVTPMVLEINGMPQLVSAAGDVIQGHRVDNGELVWTVFSQGEGVTPSIVKGKDFIYCCSGFEKPTIRAVRLGGSGTVTDTHIAWEQNQGVPSIASLLYVAPYLFAVTDAGVLTCLDAATGQEVWKERVRGKHTSSPVYADGKVYLLTELEGESIIFEPSAEYKEIGRNLLGETCKATMAVSRGNFFIRSDKHLYCIGPKPKE
ncbi:MAG: PQQ-binding-like beta-propeller repeat protein [Pirellulaceae bacterium]|nr:PQQ-binding-like beta-propeller repeat protein [Pirellulaceae bacterium]